MNDDETLARAAAQDPPTKLAMEPVTLPAATPVPAPADPPAFPAPQRSVGRGRFGRLARLFRRAARRSDR